MKDQAVPVIQDPLKAHFTPRQITILQLIATGKTDREIAQLLTIGERTVRNNLNNIYAKLGVQTRIEAVAQSIRLKLIA